MRIETRNLLADFLLDALDDSIVADALRCLAAYCRSNPTEPPTMSVEEFVAPASTATQQQVENFLQHHSLFAWEEHQGISTIALLQHDKGEYPEIAVTLSSYATALDAWYLAERDLESISAREAALQKGALLFNHHLFFEVHEILEEQWKQEEGDIRFFLQGLIQIAVAFYHLRNNNFRGATVLLHEGLAKIAPHQPRFLDVELQNFIASLKICQQELQRLGPEHCRQFPRKLIPPIKFVR